MPTPGHAETVRSDDSSSNIGQPPQPNAQMRTDGRPLTKCSHCKEVGHEVKDCVNADENGFVVGCPKCNAPHSWEQCFLRTKDSNEDFLWLIVMRQNHPPLVNFDLDTHKLWVKKGRPMMRLPWTPSFAKQAQIEGFDPKAFDYSGDPIADAARLPEDPAVAPDKQATLELGPQVFQRKRQRDSSPPAAGSDKRQRQQPSGQPSQNSPAGPTVSVDNLALRRHLESPDADHTETEAWFSRRRRHANPITYGSSAHPKSLVKSKLGGAVLSLADHSSPMVDQSDAQTDLSVIDIFKNLGAKDVERHNVGIAAGACANCHEPGCSQELCLSDCKGSGFQRGGRPA
ncbi:hypothetical protein C8A00DRAFT_31118 [Chaetomidium leptoderma]|uniref:CCHC-type domain-containing protein n=1 Tax=Chaetomidium leptoderma TaxID=669021 RepID=A0AAN6ZZN1_9PEZI|nr:hypothetical protein C8A00DRAFT_31118 [Chaetomidium leptoderma]